jgi:hypothetical protein
MGSPPLSIAAAAAEFSKQQRTIDPVSFDEEAENIARLAWMIHAGDVRGVRWTLSELGEYGPFDDSSSFAFTAPTTQLHITARWTQIDRQSGLSILQLAS